MKKVLPLIALIVLVLFLGKVGYEFYKGINRNLGIGPDTLRPALPLNINRKYAPVIKGVVISTPGSEMATLTRASEEIKNLGINTIAIAIAGQKGKDGHFYPQAGLLGGNLLLNYYKHVINEAKKQGFAVWISYDVNSGGAELSILEPCDMQGNLNSIS